MVWFINSGAAACTTLVANCGRQANPLSTLASFNTLNTGAGNNPAAGDTIFLFEGAYTGPVTLLGTQKFIGQDATASVPTLGGPALPSNGGSTGGNAYPASNPTGTTVSITSAGIGITLGSGNNLAGFTAGNATTAITGGAVGTLNVREVTINTNGAGLIISTSGTMTNTGTFPGFTSITTTGGTNGVSLTGVGGTFITTGALSGASGATLNVSGGTLSATYSGGITQANNAAMVSIAGHATGTITFQTGALQATNGTGLQFNNADGAYSFNASTDLIGGDAGIDITNGSSGTFTFGSAVNIQNPTGIGYREDTSTATVTDNGPITKTNNAANAVAINAKTGGTTTFNGGIVATTTTANAITLTNTGGTVNFTGGLSLTTTSGVGFNASGSGATVSATQNNTTIVNTIASTTGIALNVVNTTIGGSGLTFRSISANGGTNGIVLSNTGTAAGNGGLTVTGTGATGGTGGTIQNTTTRGASFITVRNITLKNMNFTNAATADAVPANTGLSTGNNLSENAPIHLETATNVLLDNLNINGSAEEGINGHNVNNFTLSNSVLTNLGNSSDEDGLHFYNMVGTCAITSTSITNSGDDNVNIQNNTNVALPAGMVAISDINISGAGSSATGGVLGSGYLFGIRGTSNTTINIDGVTSSNNFSGGVVADAFDNAVMNIRVNASTLVSNNDGISISSSQAANVDEDLTGNTLTQTIPTLDFVPINILGAAFSTGLLDTRVSGNTITVGNGVTADGMTINELGGGILRALVTGNNIFNYRGTQRAILIQTGQDGNGNEAVTVTGNTFDMQLDGTGNAVTGILAQSAITGPGNTSALDLSIGGAGGLSNTFTHSLGGVMAAGDIRVRQRNDGTVNLDGFGGPATSDANAVTYLSGRNTVVSAPTATHDSTGFSGNATVAFITVTVSPTSVAENGGNLTYTLTRTGSTAALLVANFSMAGTASFNGTADYAVLTPAGTTFNTANGTGTVTFNAGSATATVTVDPTDDGTGEFNESVVLDAGNGSFARATITNDDAQPSIIQPDSGNSNIAQQTRLGNTGLSAWNNNSQSRLGWLKQSLHPVAGAFARQAGFLTAKVDSWLIPTVMAAGNSPTIQEPNKSRLGQVSDDKLITPLSGELINVNVGPLPAGKSITLVYQATVNTPPLVKSVSTQGNVTYTGGPGGGINTDDPETGTSGDATVTNIDVLSTWTGATSTDWNTATNWNPNTYAPGVSNPAINDVVIPNVGAQPNISATDIGIFSLNISNGRTLTITSPRILTIGGAPGGNLTLDGIISGGELRLGTGAHAINNAGGTGSLSSTNLMTVLSGSTVTLSNNLSMGRLVVNAGGSMDISNRTLTLTGPGAALSAVGTFTTTGSTVVFASTTGAQTTGTVYNNLTINNSAGVTLTGDSTVNGTLALTSGDLDTGAFTLTQPNATASTGTGDVVGNVKRTGTPLVATALTYGNPNNVITLGANTLTSLDVRLTRTAPTDASTGIANSGFPGAVQRTYVITPAGGTFTTATLRLHYLDTELNSNTEGILRLWKLITTPTTGWQQQDPSGAVTTFDSAANWVQKTGVTGFSPWTIASVSPTAANGNVSGHIVDNNGNPVEGAVVRLDGTQNRKFITDSNGYYSFDNVETNGFYTVTPSRANYLFNPAQRSFSQLGNNTDAAFSATAASGSALNPLDTPEYFVRQQYLDFLGREPDESGFNFWSDQILSCNSDAACVKGKRINTSAAFFLSIEFQQTGYLVYRMYQSAYGDMPGAPVPLRLGEFRPDTAEIGNGVVVLRGGWEGVLESNKQAFVAEFVQRARFLSLYGNMSDGQFVDTLNQNAGFVLSQSERDQLVSDLSSSAKTRAQVLRAVAENPTLSQQEFSQAFVLMQYFGYLRRDPNSGPDPDFGGYNFWLSKLNTFGGNFQDADMVKAFLVSSEYRGRFPR